jgi:hypothetical protein
MTLLPTVRDQLEDAAGRRARPQREHRRRGAPRLVSPALRVPVAAMAVILVLAGFVLTGALLSRGGGVAPRGRGPGVARPIASQPLLGVGALTSSASSRLQPVAYLQTGVVSSDAAVSTPVHARAVRARHGGYELAVSFTSRARLGPGRAEYSLVVQGPAGRRQLTSELAPARGVHAGQVIAARIAPAGARLAPGVYTGVVGLLYATRPALLEGSETVYLPVGAFQVRIP